jgi:hypothetical protein
MSLIVVLAGVGLIAASAAVVLAVLIVEFTGATVTTWPTRRDRALTL